MIPTLGALTALATLQVFLLAKAGVINDAAVLLKLLIPSIVGPGAVAIWLGTMLPDWSRRAVMLLCYGAYGALVIGLMVLIRMSGIFSIR